MAEMSEVIREAAFRLFAERGYDETSVDEIVRAAGVSRSTFFRAFGSKESVIFPDHDPLLAAVEARLRASAEGSAIGAVSDAVRLVLFHYVAEGDRARERYRLTSTVPALRERELASVARYQRLFRQYISEWDAPSEQGQLRAELMAAAVVAAHNRVLRRWLRYECLDPQVEIDAALEVVRHLFDAKTIGTDPIVVVAPPSLSTSELMSRLSAWATTSEGTGQGEPRRTDH
jgi:AcrR family transcriptional regulator